MSLFLFGLWSTLNICRKLGYGKDESVLSTMQDRKQEVLKLAAQRALEMPVLESGLWFHQDIRDNFYYAMHLFAAVHENRLLPGIDLKSAEQKAVDMLLQVLALQERNPQSEMYGHWPLNLNPEPAQAKPHRLPVEIMGTLLAHFYETYGHAAPVELRTELSLSLLHIYQGNYYRQPLELCIHHEAKYVAQQLIWGNQFDDAALLAEGHVHLRTMLKRLRDHGMIEYGCLPWFWHWVQAFTCAWELAVRPDIQADLEAMLEFLWKEREQYYLQGAWVGPQSRVLAHDAPADRNTLLDYIQFGNFPLPLTIARLEYAALLSYEAPASVRLAAIDRTEPAERKKLVPKRSEPGVLHSYTYLTESYAVSGMWERVEEFDNEQQRWSVKLPANADGSVNQLYAFHPGAKYIEGDYRHQSAHCQVLLHKHTIAALYALPEDAEHRIVGCHPQGEWIQRNHLLTGKMGAIFAAIHTLQPVEANLQDAKGFFESKGRTNGVVVEVLNASEAKAHGIANLEEFTEKMASLAPTFIVDGAGQITVKYSGLQSDKLLLRVGADGVVAERSINGREYDFTDYTL